MEGVYRIKRFPRQRVLVYRRFPSLVNTERTVGICLFPRQNQGDTSKVTVSLGGTVYVSKGLFKVHL